MKKTEKRNSWIDRIKSNWIQTIQKIVRSEFLDVWEKVEKQVKKQQSQEEAWYRSLQMQIDSRLEEIIGTQNKCMGVLDSIRNNSLVEVPLQSDAEEPQNRKDPQNIHSGVICQEGQQSLGPLVQELSDSFARFYDYYLKRESDLQNCLDYAQEKNEFIIHRLNELELSIFSILSYSQSHSVSEEMIRNTAVYRYYQELHSLTEPQVLASESNFVRVGRSSDGGYVMALPISEAKIAYSIGICDDVSWDMDMVRKGYEVYQYDHTIEMLPQENPHFHWQRYGVGKEDGDCIKTLATMLQENGHSLKNGLVLKMDIEGDEWDVLSSCTEEILQQFDQIVLEIHGLTRFTQKEKMIEELRLLNNTHAVVHIHGNNVGSIAYCGDLVTPDLLEVTYINRRKYRLGGKNDQIFFDGLDYPNRLDKPEIIINKW